MHICLLNVNKNIQNVIMLSVFLGVFHVTFERSIHATVHNNHSFIPITNGFSISKTYQSLFIHSPIRFCYVLFHFSFLQNIFIVIMKKYYSVQCKSKYCACYISLFSLFISSMWEQICVDVNKEHRIFHQIWCSGEILFHGREG